MTPRRSARVIRLVALSVLTAALVGCGDSDEAGRNDETGPSTESSPFELTAVPDGYRVARAGVGTVTPTGNADGGDTIEPFTLLTADGTSEGADPVAVSYLRGSDDGSVFVAVRSQDPWPEPVRVDGRPASFASGQDWSDLTMELSGDVWVRVSSGTARSQAELVAIARDVPAPDDADLLLAPALPSTFAGLRVVGSVDAGAMSATLDGASPEGILTPAESHIVTIERSDDEWITVRTLPGVAADIDAIGRHPWFRSQFAGSTEIGGRSAVHLDCGDSCRSTVTTTDWGDLVVAMSWAVDHATLDAVLASVERTDAEGWRAIAEESFGGPELQPEAGAEELRRGTIGEVEWLLQTVPDGREPYVEGAGSGPDGSLEEYGLEVEYGIDRCLRLSDLTTACGHSSGGHGADGRSDSVVPFTTDEVGDGNAEPLVTLIAVAGYPEEAVAVRVVRPEGASTDAQGLDVTVPLSPTPIGDGHYAVIDGVVGLGRCTDPEPIAAQLDMEPPTWSRISLVDPNGDEVACVGIG